MAGDDRLEEAKVVKNTLRTNKIKVSINFNSYIINLFTIFIFAEYRHRYKNNSNIKASSLSLFKNILLHYSYYTSIYFSFYNKCNIRLCKLKKIPTCKKYVGILSIFKKNILFEDSV